MINRQNVDVGVLNFRQTIEGMPLVFQPEVAGDLKAVIQFNASGRQPGKYHLCIDSGRCTFHKGPAAQPSLTINTPSEVWLRINAGEFTGAEAFMQGLYTIRGDADLLIRMQELFHRPDDFTVQVIGQRPAGPLPLRGISWMALLFMPWTLLLFTFEIHAVSYWISLGIPILAAAFIVVYRSIFNRPLWIEVASLAFFLTLAVLGPILQLPLVIRWGSIIGLLIMGIIWLVSLTPPFKLPLTAEYSKWHFVSGLWVNSMFIQPNMAITLVWGWQFVLSAGLGIVARTNLMLFWPLTALRLLLLVPAFVFSFRYQKRATARGFKDIDRTIQAMRIWSYIGLALAVGCLCYLFFAFQLAA